jgi:hypothetical protein
MSGARPLTPQQATFAGPRPLSCRFGPVYPQQPTFWIRLGMSQDDPTETLELDGHTLQPSLEFRLSSENWGKLSR